MKVLVVDGWHTRWKDGVVKGGAELSTIKVCLALGADLYGASTEAVSREMFGGVTVHPSSAGTQSDEGFDSRAANKIRKKEIETLVVKNGYDVIFNASSSAAHVNAATSVATERGIGLVNYNHLSFHDYSFPRFAIVDALQKSKNLGAINVTTSPAIRDQVAKMVEKKSHLMSQNVDANTLFDYFVAPANMDHVPFADPEKRESRSLSILTRYSDDKNVAELLDFLSAWRKRNPAASIKACFSLAPESSRILYEKDLATLRSIGVEHIVDANQQKCFDFLAHQSIHFTASHTESFGLAPCEMACFGQPTIFCERPDRPHSLRSVLFETGVAATKKPRTSWTDDKNVDALKFIETWCDEWTKTKRKDLSSRVRHAYSAHAFEKSLSAAVFASIKKKNDDSIF